MYVLSISVVGVDREPDLVATEVSKIQRNSSQPDTTRVFRFEVGQISRTMPRGGVADHLHRPRVVAPSRVADAIGFEQLDDACTSSTEPDSPV